MTYAGSSLPASQPSNPPAFQLPNLLTFQLCNLRTLQPAILLTFSFPALQPGNHRNSAKVYKSSPCRGPTEPLHSRLGGSDFQVSHPQAFLIEVPMVLHCHDGFDALKKLGLDRGVWAKTKSILVVWKKVWRGPTNQFLLAWNGVWIQKAQVLRLGRRSGKYPILDCEGLQKNL